MESNQIPENNNVENNEPDLKSTFHHVKLFFRELLDIQKGADKQGTIQDVKDNISMKGHAAWILIFSILIASIGLNVSSTAVVIGAMLVSPFNGTYFGYWCVYWY